VTAGPAPKSQTPTLVAALLGDLGFPALTTRMAWPGGLDEWRPGLGRTARDRTGPPGRSPAENTEAPPEAAPPVV